MHFPSTASLCIRTLFFATLTGLPACQTPAPTPAPAPAAGSPAAPASDLPSAKITQDMTTTAQVVAVDQAKRLVTLKNEAGRMQRIVAGSGVRNFDQIAVGDTLKVQYQAGLAATQLPAGSPLHPPQGVVAMARAAKGAAPAAAAGIGASVRVRIELIDTARDIVVFAMSSDELIAHRIATPEGREFVKKLKVGDLVQIDYDEVLALSIEKTSR